MVIAQMNAVLILATITAVQPHAVRAPIIAVQILVKVVVTPVVIVTLMAAVVE